MTEVSNKELTLMDRVEELEQERDKCKAFGILIALISYVLMTVCYTIYDDVHNQDAVIKNQEKTIGILMENILKAKQ